MSSQDFNTKGAMLQECITREGKVEALKSTSNGAKQQQYRTALGQAFIASSAAFQKKTNTLEI